MAIRFHCEACEARVKVPGGSEGRKVKCPRCGHMQRVPQHAQAQPVAAGAVTMPEELHDADGSGSYSAQVEDAGPAPQVESRTSTKHGPRKGGLDAGDSLGELAKRFAVRDMTPPHVAAAGLEKPATESPSETPAPAVEQAAPAAAPAPRPMAAPPKARPMVNWTARQTPAVTATPVAPKAQPAARPPTPYVALRNLAVALRITPALLIPATLWHVLNTTTLSGAIVTIISGGAIVALTWAIAEIADTVRDLTIAHAA